MRMIIRKLLLWLLDKTQSNAKVPFGGYFTTGIDLNGQAPIQFIWNNSFINNLRNYGYDCSNERETVELFYLVTRQTHFKNEDVEQPVNSEAHPNLSDDKNYLRT